MKDSLKLEIERFEQGLSIHLSSDVTSECHHWRIGKNEITFDGTVVAVKTEDYSEVYDLAYDAVTSHIEEILEAALESIRKKEVSE